MIPLNAAAKKLGGLDPVFVKGVIVGLGITLHRVGLALVMTDKDFRRLERFLAHADYPMGHNAKPRPTAEAACA